MCCLATGMDWYTVTHHDLLMAVETRAQRQYEDLGDARQELRGVARSGGGHG